MRTSKFIVRNVQIQMVKLFRMCKSHPSQMAINWIVSSRNYPSLGRKSTFEQRVDKITSKFAKSIYVSRLQLNVDVEHMKNYVKNNISGIADNELSDRLLIRKEQDVSLLTYVSFRLACAEKYIDIINDSKLWPSHVMIGEFVKQRRPLVVLHLNIRTPASNNPISSKKRNSNNRNSDRREFRSAHGHSSADFASPGNIISSSICSLLEIDTTPIVNVTSIPDSRNKSQSLITSFLAVAIILLRIEILLSRT